MPVTDTTIGIAKSPVPKGISQLGPETAECAWVKTSDGTEHLMRFWANTYDLGDANANPNRAAGTTAPPIIFYLHGIEGHGRWFEETAVILAQQGILTYAPDRRGAGASKEIRGHITNYERLVSDVDELLMYVAQRHPGSSIFIMGNCWGGKVGLTSAGRDNGQLVKGLILTSPAVSVRVDVPFGDKILMGVNYLFGGGKGYFDIPLKPEHFTDNPTYLDYITNDQARLTKATASFFLESLKLTGACKAASEQMKIPLLILQSGLDLIVDVDKVEGWFNSLGSSDKTLKFFTSAAHSLDFEAEAEQYQSLLADWVLAHAQAGAVRK